MNNRKVGKKRNQPTTSSSTNNNDYNNKNRKPNDFVVLSLPKRGGNYQHYPILSRSSLSFLSHYAKKISQDDRRKILRRKSNGYACPSHVPYRQLGKIDLKLGERDITRSDKNNVAKKKKKNQSNEGNGDDDGNTEVRVPTPGLPNIKSFRPVNRLRAAADEFSNIRNDLDEKLGKTLVVLRHDRPEAFQRKYMQLSSGLHAINWRKEIESIRLGAEIERLTDNVEKHRNIAWFYNFLRDYIEHKEMVETADATSFNKNTTDESFSAVETFVINFIHRVLEHGHEFNDHKLNLLKDHLKPHEAEEAVALLRILHKNCKTLSVEHYHSENQ